MTAERQRSGSKPLLEALDEVHAQPLWDRYMRLNTREPQYHAPLIWPWQTMGPLVERAAREVDMEEAERRVLLLTHPDFAGTVFTTPTLSGGLQVLNPGESADAHRHTLAALRIVMCGSGAVTTVDGKRCEMVPGDVILTPAWSWHEHCHEGSERMVWFDGLDYPLARQLGAVFFEMGPGPVPPRGLAAAPDDSLAEGGMLPEGDAAVVPYSPLYRYAWERADRVLAAMAPGVDGSRRLRYLNPADGGPVMPTIDVEALRLAAGRTTAAVRTTATAMVVVIEGSGRSDIGDTVFHWQQHDVFTLPRWQWVRHQAVSEQATLMLVSDRELMRRLDYLREERRAD